MGNICGRMDGARAPVTYGEQMPPSSSQQRPATSGHTQGDSPLHQLGRRPVPSSSESSTASRRYVSLSSLHDPRLDSLPAGRLSDEVIPVSTATFNMMSLAHDILLRTAHETFPDGPGNKVANVLMSGGRSWMRKQMFRGRVDEGASQELQVQAIKETGGGNCGEYANMVLAELQGHRRDQPVFKVLESKKHSLVIIGDWRTPQAGDHAIVVDPWQGLKKVHTYGERSNPESPFATATLEPGRPIPSSRALKTAFSLKPMSADAVDAEIGRISDCLSSGPRYARSVIRDNPEVMFDHIAGTVNLHAAYRDPIGRESAFNSLPPSYLGSYSDSREGIVKRFA